MSARVSSAADRRDRRRSDPVRPTGARRPATEAKRSAPAAPPPGPATRARIPSPPPIDWRVHAGAAASLVLLAGVLYYPCLNGAFVYDDPNAVSQSTLIRHLWPLGAFLTLSTRPLTDYSLALNYAMGALDPWPYHATNVVLHAANALLLYGIASVTFASAPLAPRYGARRVLLAWATAALFVAHPLATEAVAYVSSRSEVLAAFWILLAFGSYLVAAGTRQPTRRLTATVVLPLAVAAGLGSKEIAVIVPLALLLYDWLFLADGNWLRTRPRRRLLALSVLPIAVGGGFLLLRAYLSPLPMGEYGATAGLGFDRFTRTQYLMTQFGVIVRYLQLVVLPVGQTFDYDWPLARTPWSPSVFLPFALLVGLVVYAVRVARTQPLVTFATGWTLLILAPTSSVVPIADLAVERRMYLPLAGLMLLAAAWLWELARRLSEAWHARPVWVYAVVVAVPLGVLGTLTYQRTTLWGDAVALHEDGVAKAPGNPRVRLNLGVTYLNLGQEERALEALSTAQALYDRQESVQAFPRIGAFIVYNLGAVLYARKEFDRAEPPLKRSIELGGQYLALRPMAYMLLSRIAVTRDDWDTAVKDMREALKYQDNPDWRVDLAEMLKRSGNLQAARSTAQQALRAQPGNQRAAAFLKNLDAQK